MALHLRVSTVGTTVIALGLGTQSCRKSEDRPPAASDVIVSSPASQPGADEPLVAERGTSILALGVEGMHCSGCVEAITNAVREIEGVRQVRVSLARRTAWVMLDDAHKADNARIVEAIEALGYEIGPAAPSTGPSHRATTHAAEM